jgi:EspG family
MHTVHWRLSPLQLDHVWESLGGAELPFPLEVRSHGSDDVERSHLRMRVRDELRGMGLLRPGDQLDADLEAALTSLARNDLSIDSVWLPAEHAESPMRVLAARSGHLATLAVQLPGESEHAAGDLLLAAIHPDALAAAVIGELPPAPPGRHPAVTVPLEQPRHDEQDDSGGVLLTASRHLDRAGRERQLAEQLVGATHLRAGEIGATQRDQHGRRQRPGVLRWFDNADDGRYLLVTESGYDSQRAILQPADANALGARLRALL